MTSLFNITLLHYYILYNILYHIFFDVVNCVKLIMQISLIHIAFDYTYM